MAVLVADVGGTNTRLGLFGQGGIGSGTTMRFANDDHATFDAVLDLYLQSLDPLPALESGCIAVAGPVTGQQARLTNRDWTFDAERLSRALPGKGGVPVRLVNDLVALGHALPALKAEQLAELSSGSGGQANDQALVAGFGTGVNVCLARRSRSGAMVMEAEFGHASLPSSVREALADRVTDASLFATVEDLFSGRGLARLDQAMCGGPLRGGPRILADYGDAKRTTSTEPVDMVAHLLGLLARELVFLYLPFGGIHFAGGVARGVLGSAARAHFLKAFTASGPFSDHIAQVPLRLITDDASALTGAALIARSEQGR